MSNGLRFFTNQDNQGNYVDPLSDAGQDGGRPGDPLFDTVVFQGDNGDVKFTRIYLHNESPQFQYTNIQLDQIDRNPGGELPIDVTESFTVQKPGGSTIDIPNSIKGTPRLKFYQDSNQTSIPEDPAVYNDTESLDDMLPNGSASDTQVIYIMMIVEPNTPTSVFDDIVPRVRAVESVPA